MQASFRQKSLSGIHNFVTSYPLCYGKLEIQINQHKSGTPAVTFKGDQSMNILFFLTPKALCSYIDDGCTLRQAMERMENSGYTALPVLDKDGGYCGVLTEGDLLWATSGRPRITQFPKSPPAGRSTPSVSTRALKTWSSSPPTRTLSPSSMIKTPSSALSRAARF